MTAELATIVARVLAEHPRARVVYVPARVQQRPGLQQLTYVCTCGERLRPAVTRGEAQRAHLVTKVVEALEGRASARSTTSDDLDALAALEQAATLGPWQSLASEVIDDGGHVAWTAASPEPIADAALIAALRNAAPALIAAARERDEFIQAACDRRAEAVRYLAERDAARAEVVALRERVEALLTWRNGRDTGGVDRLIPAADLRAALTTGGDRG